MLRAPWLTYTFVSMTALFIYALPFIVVSSATLMAKFTDESQQSTIQGMTHRNYDSTTIKDYNR